MLSRSTIVYGTTLPAPGVVGLVGIASRPRRVTVITQSPMSAFTRNAILRSIDDSNFFRSAPITIFSVSWQDSGSGVFTLAAATALAGLGPHCHCAPVGSLGHSACYM
ncbi:MAG: hypothetical protein ACRCY9_06070 [Phycicoccus sp.]